MATLNHCQFIGNVGQCETRHTQGGDAITNLSIACNERWKDKQGNMQERTEWVRVSCFGKLAEIAGQYATKGKLIYISGRLQTRKWQDNDGNDRYATEIIADKLQLLGGRDEGEQTSRRPATQGKASRAQEDFDDEIPF